MDLDPAGRKTRDRARDAVRRGRIKTILIQLGVGALTGFLGLFMLALDLLGLDSELQAAPLRTHIAVWAVAGFFGLVAVGMVAMAFFKGVLGGGKAEQLLFEHPDQIAGAWRQVSRKQGTVVTDNEGAFGSHALVLESRDGRSFQVMMSALQVTLVMRWIALAAPGARRHPDG